MPPHLAHKCFVRSTRNLPRRAPDKLGERGEAEKPMKKPFWEETYLSIWNIEGVNWEMIIPAKCSTEIARVRAGLLKGSIECSG